MKSLGHIGLVIPAYNTEGLIGGVLSQALEWIPRRNICVVDDGSEDATRAEAESFGVRVLRHARNRGKGEALKTGFRALLSTGVGAVITMDGDGQHDASRIPDFGDVASSTGAGVVAGMRPFRLGEMPPDRIFSNRTSSLIASMVCGRSIIDSQCGFRLYSRPVLERVNPRTSRYEMETEMLILACRMGFTIGWCPVQNRYGGQVSHIRRLQDTMRFIRLILRYV